MKIEAPDAALRPDQLRRRQSWLTPADWRMIEMRDLLRKLDSGTYTDEERDHFWQLHEEEHAKAMAKHRAIKQASASSLFYKACAAIIVYICWRVFYKPAD